MSDVVLTLGVLAVCSVALWSRIVLAVAQARFCVRSGRAQALRALEARGWCFTLSDRETIWGQLCAEDDALALSPGDKVTAVYVQRSAGASAQAALLFSHANARWRSRRSALRAARGSAVPSMVSTWVLFLLTDALLAAWVARELGAALDWAVRLTFSAVVATVVLGLISKWAARLADLELERRAVAALRDALFARQSVATSRNAHVNLAEPRTRYAPQALDLIVA